jgi:hypothetical protein
VRLDLERLDIHAGDRMDRLEVDIDEGLLLSALLRETLVPFVPRIADGWTFRAATDDGGVDVAATGASNAAPVLLVDDVEVRRLSRSGTLPMGARPTGWS